ncbi:hypothetical protein COXBURSA331_A1072 [Coxiella burnetii RSA 331]|nr:hypothetical protein COXBURSA331_A1072 [Coxiella burnetii RSA 331]EDR36401.1 hypothetical protein COXBURSA334_0878 [Coxiella burnetii Q321]
MMIVWENKILYRWASQAQPNLRAGFLGRRLNTHDINL